MYTKLPHQLEAQKQLTAHSPGWHSTFHACLWGSRSQAALVLQPEPGGSRWKPVCHQFPKPTSKPPPTLPLTQPSAASSAPVFQSPTYWMNGFSRKFCGTILSKLMHISNAVNGKGKTMSFVVIKLLYCYVLCSKAPDNYVYFSVLLELVKQYKTEALRLVLFGLRLCG